MRIAMLLGGFDPPDRSSEVLEGTRPDNDVGVLEREFDATIYDFGWLERRGTASLSLRWLCRLARRTGQWSAALALATAAEIRRYDVVYVSGEDVGIVACAISRLMPGPKPMVVMRVERPVYGRTALRRFVHRRAFRFASARISVALCRTAGHASYIRRATRIPPGRVRAFGQEIDTQFFDPGSEVGCEPPVRGRYLLSAGLEHRDYPTLLDAVDGLELTVVIAAGSPWSKDRFGSSRDLPPNVVVATFDRTEMRELYRSASAVVLSVLPTDRACGMNVIGEAWAMGRPVVASATAGIREFVADGQTGVLVPPGDAVALRNGIDKVLHSLAFAAALGARAQEHVRARLALANFERELRLAIELASR